MGAFRAAWSKWDHAAADPLTLHPRSQIGPCAAGWPIQTQREKPWGTGPGSADQRRVNELPFGICTRPSPEDFGGRSLAGGSGREGRVLGQDERKGQISQISASRQCRFCRRRATPLRLSLRAAPLANSGSCSRGAAARCHAPEVMTREEGVFIERKRSWVL